MLHIQNDYQQGCMQQEWMLTCKQMHIISVLLLSKYHMQNKSKLTSLIIFTASLVLPSFLAHIASLLLI